MKYSRTFAAMPIVAIIAANNGTHTHPNTHARTHAHGRSKTSETVLFAVFSVLCAVGVLMLVFLPTVALTRAELAENRFTTGAPACSVACDGTCWELVG